MVDQTTKNLETIMKTELQKKLAKVAPSISISTEWSHDSDIHPDIRKDCDGMEDENPDDWQAWRSEVCATAIIGGEEVTGSDYLGGTWEKSGDNPAESNPDISGYEADMTMEALQRLADLTSCDDDSLIAEIDAAMAAVREHGKKD